ncbi:hypothetical protein PRIPAC_89164 [Pristionchus pacificus]|uniref:G protein-coupled receptor n=1 Tax=Pristionchus pacificus TaxID=54126 RepID=A0A2A6CVW8_PRIPA|nr:hypothetical protein PRIPAC_89164 [Pristionchus pacificus]|eukprot:PDM82161.1 G protein-coupled receptor [Pristionchus pacificus]
MHVAAGLQILATVIVLLCFPVHVLIADKELESSFRVFQTQITVLNIFYTVVEISVHKPAWFGFGYDLYKTIPLLPYIDSFKAYVYPSALCVFHSLVGINQLTAVMCPFRHKELWRTKVLLTICVIAWSLSLLSSVPVILCQPQLYELNTNNSIIANRRMIYFAISERTRQSLLSMAFFAGAIIMQVATIGAYSALFIIVRRATVAPIGKQPQRVPESVRRSCLVAGIIEIGFVLLCALLLLNPFIFANMPENYAEGEVQRSSLFSGDYPNFNRYFQLRTRIRDQQFDNAIGNVHYLSQAPIHFLLTSLLFTMTFASTCEWVGTAPVCMPDKCPAGKVEIVRAGNVFFKFLQIQNSCSIGEKLLCCDPKVVRADKSKECPAGKILVLERRGTHIFWGEKFCCDEGTFVFE